MQTLFNKTILLFFLALTLPISADKDSSYEDEGTEEEMEEERERDTYYHKFIFTSSCSRGKSKSQGHFEGQVPVDEGNTWHYTINLGEIPTRPLYQLMGGEGVPAGDGNTSNDKKDIKAYELKDFSGEYVLKSTRALFKRFYKEYIDETGTQKMQFGLIGSHYDDTQVLGVQLLTDDVSIVLSLDTLFRLLGKEFLKPNNNNANNFWHKKQFTESKEGLAAFTLKWEFDGGDKFSIGVSIGKGDYKGYRDGFDIAKYFAGCQAVYDFDEPFFDFLYKISLGYTRHYKGGKADKKKLPIVPKVLLSMDLGKVELFGEEASFKLNTAWCFTDITEKNGPSDEGGPTHFAVDLVWKFKNPFGTEGIEVAPKISLKWTEVAPITGKYINRIVHPSVKFKIEKKAGEEYYVF